MKPVFKLPVPQPPRPSPADMEPLVAIYKEADKAGAHRWQTTQRNGLLRYAIEFLKDGQWDRAEDNCETALKREEELGGDYAARFAEVLIKLKDKATHKSNGEALKVSLKAEIEEKKETQNVTAKDVLRETLPRPSAAPKADVSAPLESSKPIDASPRVLHVPSLRREEHGEGEGVPVSVPTSTNRGRASGEVTPNHPLLLAHNKRALLRAYWDAILGRDTETIELAALACKEVGLEEVYKETLWQLEHRDLDTAHRVARWTAARAWEETTNE